MTGQSLSPAALTPQGPWYRGLTRYHWFVLIVCSLGWLFDTMDQQLFNIGRGPAIGELLKNAGILDNPKSYAGYATSIFIIGWATGGLVFGLLGDRWGRAKTMFLAILVYSVFTGLSAFSTTWWDFSVYRFLTGLGVGGEFAAGVSLVAEIIPDRARPYALGFVQALSGVGNMAAALISFALPPKALFEFSPAVAAYLPFGVQEVGGWRLLFLVGIVPSLLVVLVMRKLKEPESWVRAKAAQKAAGKSATAEQRLGRIRDLFGDPRWRKNAIVGIILAAAGVIGLWGVGAFLPELVRDHVMAGQDSQVQDWYASIASLLLYGGGFLGMYGFGLLTGRVGRRPAFAVAFLIGLGAIVMTFGFMTQPSQIWYMCPILGFSAYMIFGGYSIYFPELFPTRLRATGTGFCYNTARYLAAASPLVLGWLTTRVFSAARDTPRAAEGLSDLTYLSSLGSVDQPFRYAAIVVAMMYLVGLVALKFAPETRGRPLPQ
jgi:MFS family permease